MNSEDGPPTYLQRHLISPQGLPDGRPHVTLTFAQSIDAKIGVSDGTQLMLSCKQSFVMTHWMRTMHDAVLIGIGTALNDNPQLNVRHLPAPAKGGKRHHLPRPVILDPNLRLPTTCKLVQNYQAGHGRRPWVLCTTDDSLSSAELTVLEDRKTALERFGVRVIKVEDDKGVNGYLSQKSILDALHKNGIKSLMIEGGAKVIGSTLAAGVVDIMIITIAPVFVGSIGIGYPATIAAGKFSLVHREYVGRDDVLVLKPS